MPALSLPPCISSPLFSQLVYTPPCISATLFSQFPQALNSLFLLLLPSSSCLPDDEALKGDWGMYMDGIGSLRCTSDAAAQPSHPAGHDDSAEHTSYAQAGPWSPPPTRLSPPLFSGSAHDSGYIFVPTPGRPTPPVVQAEPTQDPSLPNPDELAAQIKQIPSENIEVVHGLRRSLRTDIHPPGCGTGDGKTRPAKAAVRKRKHR